MGFSRTGDGALGLSAMKRLSPLGTLAITCALLSGCKAVPAISGLVGGAAVGGATANPAVGFLVGVGIDATVDAGLRSYGKSRQRAEQDAIAGVAGQLAVGQKAPWKIEHDIPFGDEHGELHIVRLISSPLADCKEIVFSVVDGEGADASSAWYTAQICRQTTQWKWASAEPAVERWGALQ